MQTFRVSLWNMGREQRKSTSGRRIVLVLLWWSDERLLRGISKYAQEADWILDASGRHRSRLSSYAGGARSGLE